MPYKTCEFLESPVCDPCKATKEQCPKKRLQRRISNFCYRVKVKQGDLCGVK